MAPISRRERWPESWRLQRSIAGFSWDAEAGSWNVPESGDAVPLLLFYQLQAALVLRQVSGADAQIRDVVGVDADDSACRGKTCVKLSTVSSRILKLTIFSISLFCWSRKRFFPVSL